ncbi:hypothetical protein ACIQWV_38845 [Streptomyces sp. NPDC098085]|uniref:hypothetical protein n=1 Tax=Streptomyces sp. NPDC098085 TaxID=3366094 RepID=UPI00382A2D4C
MTHPFATAGFHLAEAEGELGALLRESSDIDAFLEAADRAGYRTRPRWADPRRTFRTGARELMVSILPAEVTAFIVEASRLPADALDEVRRAENSRLRAST